MVSVAGVCSKPVAYGLRYPASRSDTANSRQSFGRSDHRARKSRRSGRRKSAMVARAFFADLTRAQATLYFLRRSGSTTQVAPSEGTLSRRRGSLTWTRLFRFLAATANSSEKSKSRTRCVCTAAISKFVRKARGVVGDSLPRSCMRAVLKFGCPCLRRASRSCN